MGGVVDGVHLYVKPDRLKKELDEVARRRSR
jgi:hypothetical protein